MRVIAATVHFGNPDETVAFVGRLSRFERISKVVVVLHDHVDARLFSANTTVLTGNNRGYAAGLNRAVRWILEQDNEPALVLAANPDVELTEAQLAEIIQGHLEARADCTFPAVAENEAIIRGYRFNRWGTMKRADPPADTYPGTLFLFSTQIWKKTGGFDERYFHYYEDADFCMRLRRQSAIIAHAENVVIQHRNTSRQCYPETDFPRFAVRNHLLFLDRFGKLNLPAFCNVSLRHLLFLFRYKRGWRGIPKWYRGIQEFHACYSNRKTDR
jgi:GT2 family glycosyltransferase